MSFSWDSAASALAPGFSRHEVDSTLWMKDAGELPWLLQKPPSRKKPLSKKISLSCRYRCRQFSLTAPIFRNLTAGCKTVLSKALHRLAAVLCPDPKPYCGTVPAGLLQGQKNRGGNGVEIRFTSFCCLAERFYFRGWGWPVWLLSHQKKMPGFLFPPGLRRVSSGTGMLARQPWDACPCRRWMVLRSGGNASHLVPCLSFPISKCSKFLKVVKCRKVKRHFKREADL